jgi:pyruvate/2-oxoglutarate dehydrogenase complex dihydrolipoamide dehydrogenase (E3) component
LGGQFRLGASAPGKGEVLNFVEFLIRRVHESGVVVKTGSELTLESIATLEPDVVIVATGARPFTIPVPGAHLTVGAWDVLSRTVDVGRKVAVIGGGQVGCETAELLADQGREVTIIEMLSDLALDMGARAREPFLNKLIELGVDNITRATVTAIGDGEVFFDRSGLQEKFAGFDSVVMAVGSRADNALAEALRGQPYEVCAVGDCLKARRGFEAVHEAYAVGSAI